MRATRHCASRPRRLALVLGVAALLMLVQVHAPLASLGILWRYLVLSFDSPSTQILDEMACEKAPCSTAGEADETTRLAASTSLLLRAVAHAALPSRSALSSGIVRSPPAS